jgi:hypothetical protein
VDCDPWTVSKPDTPIGFKKLRIINAVHAKNAKSAAKNAKEGVR